MDKVSYFVVDNLHCPSCIFTVKSTLHDEVNIPATNVHISLVNHTVTVRHDQSVTAASIAHALQNIGFDVQVPEDDDSPIIGDAAAHPASSSRWFTNPLTSRKRKRLHREICKSCQAEHLAKQEKNWFLPKSSFWSLRPKTSDTEKTVVAPTHDTSDEVELRSLSPHEVVTELVVEGMTCASCANAINEGLKAHRSEGVLSSDIDVLGNSAKVIHDANRMSPEQVAKLIEEIGYGAEVVSSRPMSRRRPYSQTSYPTEFRLEFHIGGMSCASCSNAITNGLQEEDYIKSVNINLMANSGTVILSNKDDAMKVKEAVETMGFTCDLGEIAPLRPLSENRDNDVRVVRIRVDGMFCEYVPSYNCKTNP